MSKLISVIIPVYNHANTLQKSIDSVIKQTYRPIEIIVVNDGSTDNFNKVRKEIEGSFVDNNTSIKFIEQKNGGAPSARNNGFRNSKGEYIIFWDADIIGRGDMLERMHLALQQDKTASYAYSQFLFGYKKIKSQQYSARELKKNNYICTMSLIRRKDFPFFDEVLKRFQDWDLWLTMMENNKHGIFIPQVLFKAIVGLRKGISSWMPSFVYKLPFKTKKVREYEKAKDIIVQKHKLYTDEKLEKEILDIIKKSYIGMDVIHAKKTKKWLLKLKPDASYELQIAALSHDIERGSNVFDKEKRKQMRDSGYDLYKREHSKLSVKIMIELLKKYNYNNKFIKKVEYLIQNHEIGGDSEVNILRDADSISFFEDNINIFLETHNHDQYVEKITSMYNRVGKEAKKIIRGFSFQDKEVEKILKTL